MNRSRNMTVAVAVGLAVLLAALPAMARRGGMWRDFDDRQGYERWCNGDGPGPMMGSHRGDRDRGSRFDRGEPPCFDRDGGERFGRGDGPRFDGDADAIGGLGRALRGLRLTAEQREKIGKAFDARRDEIAKASAAVRDAGRELWRESLRKGADEASIRKVAESLGKATSEAALVASRLRAEVVKDLTEEQRERLDNPARERERRRDGSCEDCPLLQ